MASKKNVKAVPEQKEQVRTASVQDSSGDGKGTESERAAAGAQADGRGQRTAGPGAWRCSSLTHARARTRPRLGSISRGRHLDLGVCARHTWGSACMRPCLYTASPTGEGLTVQLTG